MSRGRLTSDTGAAFGGFLGLQNNGTPARLRSRRGRVIDECHASNT